MTAREGRSGTVLERVLGRGWDGVWDGWGRERTGYSGDVFVFVCLYLSLTDGAVLCIMIQFVTVFRYRPWCSRFINGF